MAYVKFLTRVKDLKQKGHHFEKGEVYWIDEQARVDSLVSRNLGEIVDGKNHAQEVESVKVKPRATGVNMGKKVFIVHGRDDAMRKSVSEYVKSLGLEPVVVFKQRNKGKTIIEKIEEQADACCYAIVLLSPDDYGRLKDEPEFKPRARQNVILELGYMYGKLSREKVSIILKGNIQKPSDLDGIVHIPYYRRSGWREQLETDLEGAGLL